MILKIIRRIEARGTYSTARKVKSHISQAMRYGIACGIVESDPTRDLGFALTPYKKVPRAALTEPAQIGELMLKIEFFPWRQRRLSLRLLAMTFVRVGELCGAKWDEISWDAALWRIPEARMKMKRPHIVPLSRQALDVLRELQKMTGKYEYLFPRRKNRALPENGDGPLSSLRSMGYKVGEMTAHGFRAMAATILSDQGWPSEVIERQLAHVDRNRVRAAYQRSELLEERKRMMQAWSDWLDMQCANALLGKIRNRKGPSLTGFLDKLT